jgi:hypothetical protein
MFEIIKLCLLVALMLGIGNASMYLEEVDYCSFHQQVTCAIAVLDFFMVMIPGLILAIITLSSNEFPQGFSNVMTLVIIVEFIYLLFVYGKVIPRYIDSGQVVPKNKETIKIN